MSSPSFTRSSTVSPTCHHSSAHCRASPAIDLPGGSTPVGPRWRGCHVGRGDHHYATHTLVSSTVGSMPRPLRCQLSTGQKPRCYQAQSGHRSPFSLVLSRPNQMKPIYLPHQASYSLGLNPPTLKPKTEGLTFL